LDLSLGDVEYTPEQHHLRHRLAQDLERQWIQTLALQGASWRPVNNHSKPELTHAVTNAIAARLDARGSSHTSR
jgi:hypothetical protein